MSSASETRAIEDTFSEIGSLRNEIWRFRKLLRADLSDAERRIVEKNLHEKQAAFEVLLTTAFPLALKL